MANKETRDMMEVSPKELCSHFAMIPFVVVAGKRVWQGDSCYTDWTSNIINAHFLKVIKYYCPACGRILDAPSELDQTGNEQGV